MPLRIAFDLDGVLADMDGELSRQAEALFGSAGNGRQRKLTARQVERLWRAVEGIDNFWETLEEIEPGSIARLGALAEQRRWEIIFLTKRPESAGATAQAQTQRWLEARGFRLPSVFVVQGSRGRIASALALDLVIDDRPENCLDVVADSKARAILVWRGPEAPPASAHRLGVGVVATVAECLDVLVKIDSAPPTGRRRLLSRVARLFGGRPAPQP